MIRYVWPYPVAVSNIINNSFHNVFKKFALFKRGLDNLFYDVFSFQRGDIWVTC